MTSRVPLHTCTPGEVYVTASEALHTRQSTYRYREPKTDTQLFTYVSLKSFNSLRNEQHTGDSEGTKPQGSAPSQAASRTPRPHALPGKVLPGSGKHPCGRAVFLV